MDKLQQNEIFRHVDLHRLPMGGMGLQQKGLIFRGHLQKHLVFVVVQMRQTQVRRNDRVRVETQNGLQSGMSEGTGVGVRQQ